MPTVTSALRDEVAAVAEDDGRRGGREEVDEREVEAVVDDRLLVRGAVVRVDVLEVAPPRRLAREGLDGAHAGDVFGERGGDEAEPLAHRAVRRELRIRKIAVATAMIGITESVARASRQSSQKRTTAVADKEQVFWTRVVTPSVTSWSRASTSFVRRLMITPARFRSKKPSDSFCRCRKSLLRRSARMRSPVQPGEVGLGRRGDEIRDPRDHEEHDDHRESVEVLGPDPVVKRELGEVGRSERRERRREQRGDRQRRPKLVGRGQAGERRDSARVLCQDQSSTFASRCAVRWEPACQTFTPSPPPRGPRRARRTRARGGRARRSPGRPGFGAAAPRASRGRRSGRGRGRRARRRGPGRQAVRDDDRRPALHRLPEAEADAGLGGGVHRRGGVVEDQDPRIDEQRPRDRDPLPLAAGERDPALADHGFVALGQLLDELCRLRLPRGLLDLLVGRVGPAEGDVLADARREEERILGDGADRPPKRCQLRFSDVEPVDRDPARVDVVEARHERGERRLAGSGMADQRHRLPRLQLEVDPLEHGALVVVAERDVLEAQAPVAGRQLDGVGRVGDLLRLVHHLEDPLAGGGRALRLPDPHAEHPQRHDHHRHEHVEGDERAEARLPFTTIRPPTSRTTACARSGRNDSSGT